jgi:hypothetical protein
VLDRPEELGQSQGLTQPSISLPSGRCRHRRRPHRRPSPSARVGPGGHRTGARRRTHAAIDSHTRHGVCFMGMLSKRVDRRRVVPDRLPAVGRAADCYSGDASDLRSACCRAFHDDVAAGRPRWPERTDSTTSDRLTSTWRPMPSPASSSSSPERTARLTNVVALSHEMRRSSSMPARTVSAAVAIASS